MLYDVLIVMITNSVMIRCTNSHLSLRITCILTRTITIKAITVAMHDTIYRALECCALTEKEIISKSSFS